MRVAVVCFTGAGIALCRTLCERLAALGESCVGYAPGRFLNASEAASTLGLAALPGETLIFPLGESVFAWTREHFDKEDALVYIGAAGIAVRAIAPCLCDKLTDPAVLVVDERGRHVISLLSGHVGGANELAVRLARLLHADPVITTASEVRGRLAVDTWAAQHNMAIADRRMAKEVAAALLDGEQVGFFMEDICRETLFSGRDSLALEGLPEGCVPGARKNYNIFVTLHSGGQDEGDKVLCLIPRLLCIGVGCKKGLPYEVVKEMVFSALRAARLDFRAAAQLASIDLKAGEEGLRFLADDLRVPFRTFSAEELSEVPGDFQESEFVRRVAGVGSVCERAAARAALTMGNCKAARLVLRKQARGGVTAAAAVPVFG